MPTAALDDRTFDDLLREARLRIPRYCPEWTDFNEADPGNTLVQLFAWFTELMLHRLNRVPDRAHQELLRLVNLSPRAARPAKAHIVLTPAEGQTDTVTVKGRTPFEVPAGEETVTFETTRPIDLVPYKLDAVQVWDGSGYADPTAANARTDASFRPLGWSPQPGNALYLGFAFGPDEPARPAFPAEFTLRFFDPVRPPADPKPTRGKKGNPGVTLVWEYQSSNDLPAGADRRDRPAVDALDRWRRLAGRDDGTESLTREGTVRLAGPGPDILATSPGRPPADNRPRFWMRCRLATGAYPADRVPEIGFVRANVVEVENRRTVVGERFGESDGFPKPDGFSLRFPTVDPDSLVVVVESPDGEREEWMQKSDLFNSNPDDAHYTLDPATGVVRFGDGTHGRMPPPGWGLIATTYRAGGGKVGNVAAEAIDAPPAGVDRVTNPRPATGGADAETIEDLVKRAPQAFRSGNGRAVTADDYQKLAEAVPGVGQATVLPLHHPDYPGHDIPGTLTVVIAPDAVPPPAEAEPIPPRVTQELLDRVAVEMNGVRTVGTEVHVAPARYAKIVVGIELQPADGASAAQAEEGVKRAIEAHLSPKGWAFGATFQPAQLYEVILRGRQVQGWPTLRVTVDGEPLGVDAQKRFDPDVLPVAVAVVRAEGRA